MRTANAVVDSIREDLDVSGWMPGYEGYEIVKDVEGFGWGGPTRKLILESLSNALDTVQNGDDWRDVELRFEDDTGAVETSLTVDESVAMIGELYNQGHKPESLEMFGQEEPLQNYLDAWLYDMGAEVAHALVAHLREEAEG